MAHRILSVIAFAVGALCLAVAVAFPDERVAYAQGGDDGYVDVGLTLEVPDFVDTATVNHRLIISVANHGSRTAHDVEVVVNIVYPEDKSHFKQAPAVPVGSASLENNGRSLRWSIPTLGELQGEEVWVDVNNRKRDAPNIFDYRKYPHEHFGKVTTSSFENKSHQGNNTARVWSYAYIEATSNSYNQVAGNYSVDVSVSNTVPCAGGHRRFHHHRKTSIATHPNRSHPTAD